MKKVIGILLAAMLLVSLAGCSSNEVELPKGHAEYVYVDNGSGLTFEDVEYEFITESLVKIIEDGRVYLIPLNKIERFNIGEEEV